jgi:hypothetical protein
VVFRCVLLRRCAAVMLCGVPLCAFVLVRWSQVFPPSPENANGELIWSNIVALQQDLTKKRQVNEKSTPAAATASIKLDSSVHGLRAPRHNNWLYSIILE